MATRRTHLGVLVTWHISFLPSINLFREKNMETAILIFYFAKAKIKYVVTKWSIFRPSLYRYFENREDSGDEVGSRCYFTPSCITPFCFFTTLDNRCGFYTLKFGSHIIAPNLSIAAVTSKSGLTIGAIVWEHYRDDRYASGDWGDCNRFDRLCTTRAIGRRPRGDRERIYEN